MKFKVLFFIIVFFLLNFLVAYAQVNLPDVVETVGGGKSSGEKVWFANPTDVDMYDGKLFVCDEEYAAIFVLAEKNGKYGNGLPILKIGKDRLKSPQRLAISRTGEIFVTDSDKDAVLVFSSDGDYLFKFGERGDEESEFNNPTGIAINSNGRVFVVDKDNHRVQIFSESGLFIKEFGTKGRANVEFDEPMDIAIDDRDNVYITDKDNNRIKKYDSEGKYILSWGGEGERTGQLKKPIGIAFDENYDYIFVVGPENSRIQCFDKEGKFIFRFGSGAGRSALDEPSGIFIDDEEDISHIFIANTGRQVVEHFKFIQEKAKDEPPAPPVNLTAEIENKSLHIFWQENTEGDFWKYDVYRSSSQEGDFEKIATTTEPEFVDKDVLPGEAYYYKVASIDETSNTSYSEIVRWELLIKPMGEKPKIAVFNFKDKTGKGYGETFSVYLTTAFGELNYFEVVERSEFKRIMQEQALDLTGVTQQQREAIGNLYGWDMMVVGDVSGMGERIEVDGRFVSINTGAVVVTASVRSTDKDDLRSLAERLARELRNVYHRRLGNIQGKVLPSGIEATAYVYQSGIKIAKTNVTEVGIFSFQGLADGTYDVIISAKGYEESKSTWRVESGRETKVPDIELTERDVPPPSVPRGLFATRQNNGVSLSWNPNSEDNIKSYVLYRSYSFSGNYEKVAAVSSTTYFDQTAPDDKDIYYKISAVNFSGQESKISQTAVKIDKKSEAEEVFVESEKAAESSATVPSDSMEEPESTAPKPKEELEESKNFPPLTPLRFNAEATADGIKISWGRSPEKDIDHYNIYRSSNYYDFGLIKEISSSQNTYYDTAYPENQDVYYKISAVDDAGQESKLSELVKVTKAEIASFTDPEDTEPAVDFCDEGMSAYENEDFDSAVEYLEKCVEENVSDVEYLKALGDSYKESNDHAQAIVYYERVIEIDSDDYNCRWILASEYIREKKFIEAEEQINYILDSDADEEIKKLARKLEIVVKNYNK